MPLEDAVDYSSEHGDELLVIDEVLTKLASVEAMGGRLSLIAEVPNQDPVVLAGLAAIEPANTGG